MHWAQEQGNKLGEVDVVTQGFSMQNQGKSPLCAAISHLVQQLGALVYPQV